MIIDKVIMSCEFKYDTESGILLKKNKKKLIFESQMNKSKDKYGFTRFCVFDETGQQRSLTVEKTIKKMLDDDFNLTYGFRK